MNTELRCEPCAEQQQRRETLRPGAPTGEAAQTGTHAAFLEALLRRLSGSGLPALHRLTTRDADDPAIALLDAWATVADILMFYQDRIAEEGYLRTATERRSLIELARLVGYRPRPGVAASAYLAFTVEDAAPVVIPAGTRAQSLPDPGELPQSFETAEPLQALAAWNVMRPRLTQPQPLDREHAHKVRELYLNGVATGLKPNDWLLIAPSDAPNEPLPRRVWHVKTEPDAGRTMVTLELVLPLPGGATLTEHVQPPRDIHARKAPDRSKPHPLLRLPGRLPVMEQLPRRTTEDVLTNMEVATALYARLQPTVSPGLRTALANSNPPIDEPKVTAFRVRAAPFGHNAPLQLTCDATGRISGSDEWLLDEDDPIFTSKGYTLTLDAVYERIIPGSRVLIVRDDPDQSRQWIATVQRVATVSRAAYGISGRATEVTLTVDAPAAETAPWWTDNDKTLAALRRITVYAQNESLDPAEAPIDTPEHPWPITGDTIDLDQLYPPLEAGRLLIVSGERADIANTSGVMGSELVMVAAVERTATPFDTLNGAEQPTVEPIPDPALDTSNGAAKQPVAGAGSRTILTIVPPLTFSYKPETVTIAGNVVRATQGERCEEVLGSGDGALSLQQFTLKRSPLTYVPTATPGGSASTLQVFVDGVQWSECASLAELGPTDRSYITQTDAEGKTSVIFGDGRRGARLPSGSENVVAQYRFGMGSAGNMRAGQISQLAARPLGVKAVINPLSASGGADPDSVELIRRNAPLGMHTFGRVVSDADYAAFARTFAGIGKAYATRIAVRGQELIHLTIAGVDDAPILASSDLLVNLSLALQQYGDPYQPFFVAPRELLLLVISANVRPLPTYRWKDLEPQIRAHLLERFNFNQREFGEPVLLSDVMTVIQSVSGVAYVDVDRLDAISEADAASPTSLKQALSRLAVPTPSAKARLDVGLTAPADAGTVRPAQIAYLAADLPDTLILQEISYGTHA